MAKNHTLSYMVKFLKRTSWWKLEPHPELVLEYPGPLCSAIPGEEYVIYLRWGGTARVNLNPSSQREAFEFTWYNPRTGKDHTTGTISGGAIREFSTPMGYPGTAGYRDWVLHLKKSKYSSP